MVPSIDANVKGVPKVPREFVMHMDLGDA